MKYLKLFESFDDIDSICKEYDITNYTINPDGTVDVDDDVNLLSKRTSWKKSNKKLTKLPLKFGKVTGDFDCSNNKLTSLEGGPLEVGGSFDCSGNDELESLRGCPTMVGGDFYCSENKLTSLMGGPSEVGGNFSCDFNKLRTLDGCPNEVGGDFFCSDNQLTSLEGCPSEVGGDLYCSGNPIHNIYRLFDNNYKKYQDSLDYNYFRGTDIIKSRFEEALQEIGKDIPKEIKGYRYI